MPGLDKSGLDKSGLDKSGLDKSGLEQSGLKGQELTVTVMDEVGRLDTAPSPGSPGEGRSAEGPEYAPERFEVNTEERANWLLRRLANIDAERRRVQAQTKDILDALAREEEGLRARFEADLRAWAEAEIARRGRGQTLRLHQGTLALRTVPLSVRVSSPTEALAIAKERGWPVVHVAETLDTAAFRQEALAALKETGEVVPGVTVTPEHTSFSIKFPAGEKEASA